MDDDALSVHFKVDGCRVEGRLENVVQRHKELQRIHAAVLDAVTDLTAFILAEDTSRSERSVIAECYATLGIISHLTTQLSLGPVNQKERHLEKQHADLPDRTVRLGNLLILASSETPVAQALVSLAYAIAAGNSPILVLDPRLPRTSGLIRSTLLTSGIDLDAIGIISPTSDSDKQFTLEKLANQRFHGFVVQTEGDLKAVVDRTPLFRSNPTAAVINATSVPSIFIVTRHAQLCRAARDIALAQSYSARPLRLLVDETMVEGLRGALVREANRVHDHAESGAAHLTNITNGNRADSFAKNDRGVWKLPGGRVVLIGAANTRTFDQFAHTYRSGAEDRDCIYILAMTSMEASISVVSAEVELKGGPPPIVYIYSNPSEARYLSLFAPSATTFVGQVPLASLLLPPHHDDTVASLARLYSRPSPVRSSPNAANSATLPVQLGGLRTLVEQTKLEGPKQPLGSRMGFFPQGGLVGLTHLFTATAVLGTLIVRTSHYYFGAGTS